VQVWKPVSLVVDQLAIRSCNLPSNSLSTFDEITKSDELEAIFLIR